jgi:enoyl-CoA hydratase/carnithine racemase
MASSHDLDGHVRVELGADGVCVLTLLLPSKNNGTALATEQEATSQQEHRFNPRLCAALASALDLCLEHRDRLFSNAFPDGEPPSFCIITTNEVPSSSPRAFFSAGIDTAPLASDPARGVFTSEFFESPGLPAFLRVLERFLQLPCPTIAAVNGHVAAAGFIFALAHDVRLMRRDHGLCYFPAVIYGLPLKATGFFGLVRAKLSNAAALRDVVLFGRKFVADECCRMGFVDEAHNTPQDVTARSRALAQSLKHLGRPRTGASIALARMELCGGDELRETIESMSPSESARIEQALHSAERGRGAGLTGSRAKL